MFSIEPGLTHRWAKRPQVIPREPLEIGTPESDVVEGELSIVVDQQGIGLGKWCFGKILNVESMPMMWQKVIAAQFPPTSESDRSTTHPPLDQISA